MIYKLLAREGVQAPKKVVKAGKRYGTSMFQMPLKCSSRDRACNNLLPTKENLYQTSVVSDMICPICCGENEMVAHILWYRPYA